MTAIDWLVLLFAGAFIGVLVFAADEIKNTEDGDGYNDSAIQEDQHTSGQPYADANSEGTAGASTRINERSGRDTGLG